MAKVQATQIDTIFGEIANSTLTGNEIKVFSAWFRDAPHTFSANPDIISDRTNIHKSNVKKILKSLVKKGALIKGRLIHTPSGQYVQSYDLGKIPQKNNFKGSKNQKTSGVKKSQKAGSPVTPIYTNTYTNKSNKGIVEVEENINIFKEKIDVSITPEELDLL